MDPKIGVYICRGCDIGKSLDVDKLVETATASADVSVCKSHDIFCTHEGVELIKNDIGSDGLNRIVVCACSGRIFPELFEFGADVLTERVNIREYVAWSHPANDEDTKVLAEDYMNMGIAKV